MEQARSAFLEAPIIVLPPRRSTRPSRRAPGLAARAALAASLLGAPCWAAGPPVLIGGRLEAPGGVPAGARVDLLPAVLDHEAARRQLAAGASAPRPEPLATARPSRDGAFTLQAPAPGCYRVVAGAPGYLTIELLLPLIEDRDLPPARLEPASPQELLVLDPGGAPLPGVLMTVRGSVGMISGLRLPDWQPAERSGRTGPGGRFTFPRRAGEVVVAKVLEPRFLGQELLLAGTPHQPGLGGSMAPTAPIAPIAPTAPEVLRLAERPAVTLEAAGSEGGAVAGARLRSAGGPAIGITGGDGRLEIVPDRASLLGPASFLALEDSQGGQAAAVSWSEVRGGRLRVRLSPSPGVVGQLVDAESGKSVAGGLVWAERPGGWTDLASIWPLPAIPAMAAGAADGRFELRLPPGTVRWKAGAPGYLTARVEAPPRGTTPWRIPLTRAADLEGQVVDAAGRAVADARVEARDAAYELEIPPSVSTDAAGHFRLRALAFERHYRLDVTAAGFVPASVLARVPGRGPSPSPAPPGRRPVPGVRIVLDPGRTAAGVVVDRDGKPVPGAAVVLTTSPMAAALAPSWALRQLSQPSPGDDAWRAAADARGAVELRHLPPGGYRLLAGGPGFATTLRNHVEIFAATAHLDLGRIVLDPAAPILGVVTDSRGAPIERATVTSKPLGGAAPDLGRSDDSALTLGGLGAGSDAIATGLDGRFVIAEARAGQHFELAVDHPEHVPARLANVTAPVAEPLHIELADGARLAGRVTDAAGEPVLGAQVSVSNAPRGIFAASPTAVMQQKYASTGADGRFSISGLAQGTFDLAATADGYRRAAVEGIHLTAGREAVPLEITLDRGSSLAGRVRDGSGKPVSEASIVAFRTFADPMEALRSPSIGSASSDADGAYRLAGLDPGTYRVAAGAGKTSVVDILPGENHLDLTADPPEGKESTVTGRIADAAGVPVADATLWLDRMPDARSSGMASSLSDGSFSFSHIAPGRYRLAASARGFAPLADPPVLDLAGSPVDGLALTLERADAVIAGRLSGLTPEELRLLSVVAKKIDRSDLPAAASESAPALPALQVTQVTAGDAGDSGADLDNWPLSTRDPSRQAPGTVDESGSYRVAGLAPGTWYVTAVTGTGRSAGGRVTLAPEATEAILDLDFAGGLTLAGRLSVDSRPVVGAPVILREDNPVQTSPPAATGADGTFRISNLRPGTYDLGILDVQDLIAVGLSVTLTADQEIAFEVTTGSLRGRVVTAAGEPVAGATVDAEASDPSRGAPVMAKAITDGDGTFELARLPANLYRIAATKAGTGTGQASVTVAPGAAAAVEIALAPPGPADAPPPP